MLYGAVQCGYAILRVILVYFLWFVQFGEQLCLW